MSDKKVFVVRHCEYHPRERAQFLTPEGIVRARGIGERLVRELTLGSNIEIITSPEMRAQRTARYISEVFTEGGHSWQLSTEDDLRSCGGEISVAELDAVVKLIQNSEADTLILVTHYEIVRDLPRFIAREFGYRHAPTKDGFGSIFFIDPAQRCVGGYS